MSRISPAETPEDQEVADYMRRWTQTKGYAPNAWQTMLRRPRVFLAYRDLHTAVMMDEGEVPKALKFMVAEVVSNAAGCFYCTAHNAENALNIGGVPPEKIKELEEQIEHGLPIVLVSDGDIGGLVGIHLREEMKLDSPVISIDGITLSEFDFIDIGEIIPSSGAVPVVIKSLVFPASATAAT